MSGFSADWLALREPADHAARNAPLARAAAALLPRQKPARILDLGCGAGSNFRGFSPFVSAPQSWTLADHDAGLLEAARLSVSPHTGGGGAKRRTRPAGGRPADTIGPAETFARAAPIALSFKHADLGQELETLLSLPCDLVTAAAFFDLASPQWITRFCAALAARRLPLYAVLTYDGLERWHPAQPLDAAVLAAFHAHQAGDKGFGPSAGPLAHGLLAAGLKALGYHVRAAASPWRLTRADAALMAQLADGIASAACETGMVSPAQAQDWRLARRAADGCEIGHRDLLAVPG